MIKQLKLTMLMLVLCGVAKAQLLKPQTLNATGKSSSNGGVLLEYSVGGLLVHVTTTPTFMYTQDFLQPAAGTTNTPPLINDVVLSTGSGLDNAGRTFSNGGVMIEFTVGEAASITLNSSGKLLTQGILQPFSAAGVVPVTALEFYARRLNSNTVQLDWKTIQEINNKGFHIERRKENESSFKVVHFAATNASGGNSSIPLSYTKTDDNNFAGNTYYRLRQEDINGKSTTSVIRIVKGDAGNQISMQVWPVPSTGPVNVKVGGLTKPDILMVYDITGKLIQQQTVQNNTVMQLNISVRGTYVLRLAENKDVLQKIIIQ